jgi:oxygen-independent coproporphyrinogen-3 oxidase
MDPLYSVYLHIPFCQHRCSYCDFNTYAGLEALIPGYISALCREIQLTAQAAVERLAVHTVFFGGGTPSLIPAKGLERVIGELGKSFGLQPGAEITLESNPGTLSLAYLQDLHNLGINRLSLGMQSAQPGELRLLDRQHNLMDLIQSVDWARQAGFVNLNLDLIYGIPYQTVSQWEGSLRMALSLQPEHLSLYALTLEHGTPFEAWIARGLVLAPDDDLAADMYETASALLEEAGFVQYEISNWAERYASGETLACRHNLQYWRLLPYLGFGAGAHGFAKGIRTANILSPGAYIQKIQNCGQPGEFSFPATPAADQVLPISRQIEMGEYMMMGLRLIQEGVNEAVFQDRFGASLETEYGLAIAKMLKRGLLEWDKMHHHLRLTQPARLVANQVFCEFV